MTTGPAGVRFGPSGVGDFTSCRYWVTRNMETRWFYPAAPKRSPVFLRIRVL